MMDKIAKAYPNDVQIVIKNYPLKSHKQATKAAIYCLAADRQGKYYEMYKMIFDRYKELKTNGNLPVLFAKELGLDMDQFYQDVQDPAILDQINLEKQQLRSTKLRLSVPKFLVNGKEWDRKQPLTKIIDDILTKEDKE